MSTYNIQYGKKDFFYNSMDINGGGVIDTFPFDVSYVTIWANTVTGKALANFSGAVNIFDLSLANIILNPTYDFKNSFLKGNLLFNNTFSSASIKTSSPGGGNGGAHIGNIIYGNVKGVRNPDGGTSTVIGNPGYQRCNFREVCTIKHLHYSCTTQKNNDDCNCLCTGPPVYDDTPHSHCSTFTNDIPNAEQAVVAAYKKKSGLGSWASTYSGTGRGAVTLDSTNGDVNVPYSNYDDLSSNDILVRTLIYDYYAEVYKNKTYMEKLSTQMDLYDTKQKATMDSSVDYKTKYLNVFNIITGILVVSGYIYVNAKK
jgi:hypothetical protein